MASSNFCNTFKVLPKFPLALASPIMSPNVLKNKSTQQYKYQIYMGSRGRDRMVVGIITTCALSAYHH
jgi:hypothetical protein